MKGTKEKEDLLIAKPQTNEQDGLTYVKSCRRREAALNTGRRVEDSVVRQNIEECIKGLRIKEYRDRVSEQLRVSHPAPNRVTWEDLEVIVEVQDKLKNDAEAWALTLQQELVRRLNCVYSCFEARQMGLDLSALVSAMRRSGSASKTGDRRRDPRKKEQAQHGGDDAKKPVREANNAERQKPSYSKVPPPDASKKFQCDWCFTRLPHSPDRCYTGCRDSRVTPNFHKDRQNSKWPDEVKNAQMRAYNIAHRFDKHKMGITTKEWLKLPEAKQKQPQQQQVAASAEVKEKLAAELSGLQAGSPPKDDEIADAQALSEASDADTEYNSNFTQQAEYEEDEQDCPAGGGLGGGHGVGIDHAPSLQASAAVALGNTQQMRGFQVKTPEEFDRAAQVPRAVPPDVLSRKVHLLASNLRSSVRACSQIAAILISQNAIDLPKDIENLVALEELLGKDPNDAAEQPAEVNEHELEDTHAAATQGASREADGPGHRATEEMPLDEMPSGVVDSVAAQCAAAAYVDDLGVVDFSDHGHVRAGTIKTSAYDALRAKMAQHLTDEQVLLMAQVQPICKLQNATLYEGLALVSSGGELMLYRAILMDTGANCNIISISVVRRLGLTIYEATTGAKVTRCDNSPTKFTHYCYVDVILAAGTPHMTLHRLYAFVTFEAENSWDLLIGTGPLKNSLMIDIKLGSGVAVSHAPTILGMNAQVVLPLVDMTPPKRPDLPRRVDPVVCLQSEIFAGLECDWLRHTPLSTSEERFAASGIQCEHIDDHDESPVTSQPSSPRLLADLPRHRVATQAEIQEQCRRQTCSLEGGRRSSLPSLTPAVQAASEHMLEQFYKEPDPWKGGHAKWVTDWTRSPSRVNAGDHPSLDTPLDYHWADQRLYLDRHHVARLCRILQNPAQDMPSRPSREHVCVEFARCLEQKWVTMHQLMTPNWLHVDQKLKHDDQKNCWVLDGDYMTNVPSSASKQDVARPRESRSQLDYNPIQRLQSTLQSLLKYPSGEVTGTLMWDLRKRVFCVQPSAATQQLDLLHCTLSHVRVSNREEVLDELQLPHWYESTGVWTYQLLRYLCPVDIEALSDGILRQYARHGGERPPLELVFSDSSTKYYPVGDGLGGPGRVFSENAAAQEYLRLGEMRKMLKSVDTRQQGHQALYADAKRRPPPSNDMAHLRLTKRAPARPPVPAAVAGPSRAAAVPSQAVAGPSQAAAGPSRARSASDSPPRSSRVRAFQALKHGPTPSPASSDGEPVDDSRALSSQFVCAAAARPSQGESPPASPAVSNDGTWANSIRVPRDARPRSSGGAPSTPPSPPRARQLSQSPTRAPPSPAGSDWDAVQMATSSVSSVGRFLTVAEVSNLRERRNLTVFMVKFAVAHANRCRDQRIVYELGVCNQERGLRLRDYPGITSAVVKKHNKTITCGQRGWRLPLGGQTTSANLLEAIMSAYADLSHRGSGQTRGAGYARNVEFSLCKWVELGSAHVLRCMAHPNATPVHYIFMDDQRCLSWRTEFTNDYLVQDDRKFICMQWGYAESAAPWLQTALRVLEARLLPPRPPNREARVAVRPEHVDTSWARNVDEVRDPPARRQWPPSPGAFEHQPIVGGAAHSPAPSVDRHGTATHVVPAPSTSRMPASHASQRPPSPAGSNWSEATQAFQHYTDEQRDQRRQAHFQQGFPGTAGGQP
ncbi:hypothetical protein CYMTET_54988 [Cymbomonas tetramitiformis]|uniref:Uncharacterized protein n=1 Tax=Cymbomonas tetramitiformis TaxID=36881 RepID=A0AAE0BEX5_9CHLO|nr:hypothetical protein CYMTET_54988 [Cymbomonas tetramitiformis]